MKHSALAEDTAVVILRFMDWCTEDNHRDKLVQFFTFKKHTCITSIDCCIM
jgi:hypothetical protein